MATISRQRAIQPKHQTNHRSINRQQTNHRQTNRQQTQGKGRIVTEPPRPTSRRPVTRREVAHYAGVSTAVVSYVVNGGPKRVAPGTEQRVRDAIAALGYTPNAVARALSRGSAQLIGLIAPDMTNPYFAEFAGLLADEATAHGYDMITGSSRSTRDGERRIIDKFVSRQVNAMIMMTALTPAEHETLSTFRVPRVLVGVEAAEGPVPSVGSDLRGGAVDAVRHLLGHGHRSIGLIIGRGRRGALDSREVGWRTALDEARVPGGPVEGAEFTRQGGYQAAQRMLALDERPTAIFAGSDLMGVGALRAIHEAGLRVPEDVAVVAFDGSSEAEFSWPAMTTVRQPIDLIARQAIALALDPPSGDTHVLLPTELILRRSCGCGTPDPSAPGAAAPVHA